MTVRAEDYALLYLSQHCLNRAPAPDHIRDVKILIARPRVMKFLRAEVSRYASRRQAYQLARLGHVPTFPLSYFDSWQFLHGT